MAKPLRPWLCRPTGEAPKGVRARPSELAEEFKAGVEKVITRNGESPVALIDAARLDSDHRLAAERMTLLLSIRHGRQAGHG